MSWSDVSAHWDERSAEEGRSCKRAGMTGRD